jgi:hypothetical protein
MCGYGFAMRVPISIVKELWSLGSNPIISLAS